MSRRPKSRPRSNRRSDHLPGKPRSPKRSFAPRIGLLAAVLGIVGAVLLTDLLFAHVLLGRGPRGRPWQPEEGPAGPWNVLLVSLDTTRPDRLAACDGGPVATPALDRIRGGGFLFTQMITPAPNTLPAHASLLTGLNPYAHGVRENVEHALPPAVTTLAEAFVEAGYATAAFVAAFVLDRRFGLAQGFELYEDRLWGPEPGLGPQTVELRGDLVADRAIRWLGEYAGERRGGTETRPYFLFVHFFDAHAPYLPAPPYDRAYAGDPYNGELAYQDACLGRLLDALEVHGEARRTLVWVVSDHGEALGEHGEPQHSIFVYDCTVRAVSLLRMPPADGRYRAGQPRLRVGAQTSLVSVAATLLDLVRLKGTPRPGGNGLVPSPAATPIPAGASLLPLLRDETWTEQPVYCETLSPLITYHWAPLYAVRTTDWKYIRAPQPELYDLRADPGEQHNLADRQAPEQQGLERALDAFLAGSAVDAALARRTPTAQERERLRSLGYLSAEGEESADLRRRPEDLPDPKAMLAAFDVRYQQAKRLLHERRFDEAAAALRAALRVDPFNNALLLNLATALRGAQRAAEASAAYREALRIQPDSPRAWHGWGQALLQADQVDSALWAYESARELQPASPDPWVGRAAARWLQGHFRDAAADLDSALERGADPILIHGLLARLYRDDLGQVEAADRHLAIHARLRRMAPAQAAEHLPRIR